MSHQASQQLESQTNFPAIINDYKNVDLSKLIFAKPTLTPIKAKVINVKNPVTTRGIEVETPFMFTWGASKETDPTSGEPTGKYSIHLQFPTDEYETEETRDFLQFLKDFYSKVKDVAFTKSVEWFGKQLAMEVIEDKIKPMLKYPRKQKGSEEVDETRPPSLKVKIQCNTSTGVQRWSTEVYNDRGELLFQQNREDGEDNASDNPISLLPSKSNVKCLLSFGGIWIISGNVHVTWNLKQAAVKTTSSEPTGICKLSLKPASKQSAVPCTTLHRQVAQNFENVDHATLVEDTDDEEDEKPVVEESQPAVVEEEHSEPVAEEPEPTVVGRRKVIRKTK